MDEDNAAASNNDLNEMDLSIDPEQNNINNDDTQPEHRFEEPSDYLVSPLSNQVTLDNQVPLEDGGLEIIQGYEGSSGGPSRVSVPENSNLDAEVEVEGKSNGSTTQYINDQVTEEAAVASIRIIPPSRNASVRVRPKSNLRSMQDGK